MVFVNRALPLGAHGSLDYGWRVMKSVFIPLVEDDEVSEEVQVERENERRQRALDDYGIVEEPEPDIALEIDMRGDELGTDPDELRPMLNMSGEPDFQHEREGTIAELSSNEVLCERTQLYVPVNRECLCGETHGRVLSAHVRVSAQNAVSNKHINISTKEKVMENWTKLTVYKISQPGQYGDCAVTFQLQNGVSQFEYMKPALIAQLGIEEGSILEVEHVIGTGPLKRSYVKDGIEVSLSNPQQRVNLAGTINNVGKRVGLVAGSTVAK